MHSHPAIHFLSRRRFLRLATIAVGAVAVAGCTSSPETPASPSPKGLAVPATGATKGPATGRKAGVLRVALASAPPSLDPHWSGSQAATDIHSHVVESLFSLGARLEPVPGLAESLQTSPDGLTHTVRLRKGVLFHNGDEMVAEDVEASLNRWARFSATGAQLFSRLASFGQEDERTLVFRMRSPYASFASALCQHTQGAVIMPREVIEQSPLNGELRQLTGTGPYRLAEDDKGVQTRLVRWERYLSSGPTSNGAGGKKSAYFDEIRFRAVADQSARIAGVQSGEYELVKGIDAEQYSTLKSDSKVSVLTGPPTFSPIHHLNLKSEVTGDLLLRQAVLAALDPGAALQAGWGDPDLYRVSGALMPHEGPWYGGSEPAAFNQRNLEKAKSLLDDSGYQGRPIRYLTTQDYPSMYRESAAISQQLQALGLNVQLTILDWASLTARRALREQWEIFSTWHRFAADPSLAEWNDPRYPGWWTGKQTDALREELLATTEPTKRLAVMANLQALFDEFVPALKLGDVREIALANLRLRDVSLFPQTMLWNAYMED